MKLHKISGLIIFTIWLPLWLFLYFGWEHTIQICAFAFGYIASLWLLIFEKQKIVLQNTKSGQDILFDIENKPDMDMVDNKTNKTMEDITKYINEVDHLKGSGMHLRKQKLFVKLAKRKVQ